MPILGLSFDFHDSSAAITDSNGLICAAAEERFTLKKHDASFPRFSIENCLSQSNFEIGDLDSVIYYEQPHEKFTRVLDNSFDNWPKEGANFVGSMRKWLGRNLWLRNNIASRLNISPRKIEFASHHHSHIAQAFYPSQYPHAAVLVVDGVGEWTSTTLAAVNRQVEKSESFTTFEEYEYPYSIGLIYSAFTAFLGFKPNSGESSTMALAGYGEPKYRAEVEKVIRSEPDGTYVVEPTYFNFSGDSKKLFSTKFIELFGSPRNIHETYLFNVLGDHHDVSSKDQKYADIAASLQCVLEEVLLGLAKRLKKLSGEEHLCFSGGVALNCLANTRLIKESGFESVFIPSEPGDGGAAMGAAYLGTKPTIIKPYNPYLGADIDTSQVMDLLNSGYLHRLHIENAKSGIPKAMDIQILELNDDTLIIETVKDLKAGRIVGWMQGRFEYGPRALGNRSIIIDPSNTDAMRRLSYGIKSHTGFRPYALSVTDIDAKRLIDCNCIDQPALKWMQTVWPVQEAVRDKVKAGVHVDFTTRPQICSIEDNPLYYKLLSAFGEYNGISALLNTSFNERSMPIVGDPLTGLSTFLRTAMDSIVIGNILIRKKYSC